LSVVAPISLPITSDVLKFNSFTLSYSALSTDER
jgi:hypothetical protein